MEDCEKILKGYHITLIDRGEMERKAKAHARNRRVCIGLIKYILRQLKSYSLRLTLLGIIILISSPPSMLGNRQFESQINVIPSGSDIMCFVAFTPCFVDHTLNQEVVPYLLKSTDSLKDTLGVYMPLNSSDIHTFVDNYSQVQAGDIILAVDGVWYTDAAYREIDFNDLIKDFYTLTISRLGKLISVLLKTYTTLDGKKIVGFSVDKSKYFSGKVTFFSEDSKQIYGLGHGVIGGYSVDGAYYEAEEQDLMEFGVAIQEDLFAAEITLCSEVGIIGEVQDDYKNEDLAIPLGVTAKMGAAELLSDVDKDGVVESYDVLILKDTKYHLEYDHVFKFIITDKTYREKYSAVIRGMSGSAIIQDGKLIGALALAKEKEYIGWGTYSRDLIQLQNDVGDELSDIAYFDDYGINWLLIPRILLVVVAIVKIKKSIKRQTRLNKRWFQRNW